MRAIIVSSKRVVSKKSGTPTAWNIVNFLLEKDGKVTQSFFTDENFSRLAINESYVSQLFGSKPVIKFVDVAFNERGNVDSVVLL